jgi:hypothetical protein
MLLSYVLRIVKTMNFIHYERCYNVLNNLINLYKYVLLNKIIALTMLHILQAPKYFNDYLLLCYCFKVVYLICFPFNLLRIKSPTSCIIV